MKLKETARRIWRYFEAIADAAEYDPLAEITARVERLERTVADLGKRPETSAKRPEERAGATGVSRLRHDRAPFRFASPSPCRVSAAGAVTIT